MKPGSTFFGLCMRAKPEQSLNALRYYKYMALTASSNRILRPETLPPTESAARYHARRVYLQVNMCNIRMQKLHLFEQRGSWH